jgi:hypothetical protein
MDRALKTDSLLHYIPTFRSGKRTNRRIGKYEVADGTKIRGWLIGELGGDQIQHESDEYI